MRFLLTRLRGEPVDELPMTGIGLGPLVLLASALLGGGVELVRRHR